VSKGSGLRLTTAKRSVFSTFLAVTVAEAVSRLRSSRERRGSARLTSQR
jgi:hypothetical protein